MPDRRQHRGPHPQDQDLFAAEQLPKLNAAIADLAWLLSRGYAATSSLKLVGDRFGLLQRQRTAVQRAACSDDARAQRVACCRSIADLAGQQLELDGYNVLTTLEAALGGGLVFVARDASMRDLASMHGTYRKVAETMPALKLLGQFLEDAQVAQCRWLLDRPVSNSGRLKQMMLKLAAEQSWPWEVELVADPDPLLSRSREMVATSDSVILDGCQQWVNLARAVVTEKIPDAWLIELTGEVEGRI